MSNPKVFEFAKEVGLTPLALMDKIKEWQLPVKSHMAELEPELLEKIKLKLKGGSSLASEEVKPKKVVARKTPAKKAAVAADDTASAVASAAQAGKPSVIRRKTKEVEDKIEARNSSGDSSEVKIEESTVVAAEPAVAPSAPQVVPQSAQPEVEAVALTPAPKTIQKIVTGEAAVKAVISEAKAETKLEVKSEAGPTAVSDRPTSPAAPIIARKKEVVVGTSGVASSATVASAPKRNIIGRMDLSRVQPPQGSYGGGGGGYRGNNDRGPSTGGTGFNSGAPRPGGFNRPAPGGAGTRNIRTGFVSSTPEIPFTPPVEGGGDFKERDLEKRNKKIAGGVGTTAREKEEATIVDFNAVEFRKREMVFQPKKKTNILERAALKTQITTPSAKKRVLKVNGTIKVADAAMEMGLKAPQIIKVLMQNGVMANLNTELDFDTIALIVSDFGWEAMNVYKTADEFLLDTAFGNLEAPRITRPPVVTVMGHVDHGKTSLLDAIRNADVARGEAGGITQHIGAYSVTTETGHLVTFLDTPGHEAFTAMRARGANATDIAIIVVAADDGMMPQTQEAVSHAKAAGVPMIIAVNKIDKPGANPEKIKQQLTEMEIVPEEWGGNTIFVEVSALKKTGITKLLENINLLAEVGDFKANPERSATGIVIEAKVEKGKGPVATLLVKDGTIKVGQYIVAGIMKGRVKSLTNDRGERVDSVGPGLPVEVLGLESAPGAGDKFDVVKDENTANKVSDIRKDVIHKIANAPAAKLSLEDIFSKVKSGDVKEMAIILKADVQGSLEAVIGMIGKLSTPEVKAKIIHTAVGGINESDVLLANTAKGIVIGFGVRPDTSAQQKSKQLGVDIRTYSIVYELIDDLKKAMGGLLSPDVVEEVLGRIEVRNTFTVPKVGTIAGCFVVDGKVQRNNMIRLVRDGKIVYEGKIASLKRFKDDAKEVATGYECGIGIENFNDVKVGDIMESYIKKEVIRELEANPG